MHEPFRQENVSKILMTRRPYMQYVLRLLISCSSVEVGIAVRSSCVMHDAAGHDIKINKHQGVVLTAPNKNFAMVLDTM